MRSTGNFHQEWGYLAPAPGFMRTARISLIAAAVGATAGATVVLSLVDRTPAASETSVAARTLAPPSPLLAGTLQSARQLNSNPAGSGEPAVAAMAASAGMPATAPRRAGAIAFGNASTVADLPAADRHQTIPDAAPPPVQKKPSRKHHLGTRYTSRSGEANGGSRGAFAPLRSLRGWYEGGSAYAYRSPDGIYRDVRGVQVYDGRF